MADIIATIADLRAKANNSGDLISLDGSYCPTKSEILEYNVSGGKFSIMNLATYGTNNQLIPLNKIIFIAKRYYLCCVIYNADEYNYYQFLCSGKTIGSGSNAVTINNNILLHAQKGGGTNCYNVSGTNWNSTGMPLAMLMADQLDVSLNNNTKYIYQVQTITEKQYNNLDSSILYSVACSIAGLDTLGSYTNSCSTYIRFFVYSF